VAVVALVVEGRQVIGNRKPPLNRFQRVWRHWWFDERAARRLFDANGLTRLERAVHVGENSHRAEVCVAIETRFDVYRIWAEVSTAYRANQVFALLGVWDTAENNGVLLYINLADRKLELRVDRAVAQCCSQGELDEVIAQAQTLLHEGDVLGGLEKGLACVHVMLARHFPGQPGNSDELRNRPVLF
jgi:TPM domain